MISYKMLQCFYEICVLGCFIFCFRFEIDQNLITYRCVTIHLHQSYLLSPAVDYNNQSSSLELSPTFTQETESIMTMSNGITRQIAGLVLALALGVVSGILPARQATRVDPVDVLREA